MTKKKKKNPPGGNSDYRKVAGYKINIQMSIVFLYVSNDQVEFEIKNKIPFSLAPPK